MPHLDAEPLIEFHDQHKRYLDLCLSPKCGRMRGMAALFIILILALIVIAPIVGSDSRIMDDRDPRGWWPGRRRAS